MDEIVRDLEGDGGDTDDAPAMQTATEEKSHGSPSEKKENPAPKADEPSRMAPEQSTLLFDDGDDDDSDVLKSDLYINIDDGEYYDSFDEIPDDDEEYSDGTADEITDTDEETEDSTLPWDDEPEEDDTGAGHDDFSLSEDDIPTGTGMLDIVKKVSGSKDREKNDDFYDLDELISSAHISSDEFDRVFNTKNSDSNVDEIMRQPLISPEAPENPKKHSKF